MSSPAVSVTAGLPGPRGASALPLCVDLDGTLIRGDIFREQIVVGLMTSRLALSLPWALLGGRARLKAHVAERSALEPASLVFRMDVLAWLRAERARGRRLILVTAADISVARRVAEHLGIFHDVMASEHDLNLKGAEKAKRLVHRFGEGGFAYLGDSWADLTVWRHAGSAIPVGRRAAVLARMCGLVERVFDDPRGSQLAALARGLRIRQWVKNVLVFVPPVTARAFDSAQPWVNAGTLFAAFCLVASSVYLVNDLLDLSSDRAHPVKRHRPIASGELDPLLALLAAGALLVAGLVVGAAMHSAGGLLAYVVLSTLYSHRLKTVPLVDVFALAGLHVIRVVAGGIASGHPASHWLVAFSGFLFLGLALVKRVAELRAREYDRAGHNRRRPYEPEDRLFLEMFGVTSSVASCLLLALWTHAQFPGEPAGWTWAAWGLVPTVLLWQMRLWLSTWRGTMQEDPMAYAVRDWVTRLAALTGLGLFLLAKL